MDKQESVELVDDSENIRTVIVNTDADINKYDRLHFNLDWNLRELTDFLTKTYKMQEPCRLRNLTSGKLFVREELDTPLRNYPDFVEGGARVQIEEGRYPTMVEIVIRVALNSN